MGCIEGYEVMTAKSEERLELAKLRLEHAQFNTQRLIHKGYIAAKKSMPAPPQAPSHRPPTDATPRINITGAILLSITEHNRLIRRLFFFTAARIFIPTFRLTGVGRPNPM